MPRLSAAKFDYSGSMEHFFNEYVTTLPSTIPNVAAQQTDVHQTQQILNTVPSNLTTNFSNIPGVDSDEKAQETTAQKLQEQQIHTISSSDDDELVMEHNTNEQIADMSSEGSGDFEGFEDYTTPNSSNLINDTSQEDFNISSNYLKRHSHNDYLIDSDDALEAVELDDDEDEEIAIADDGEIIYRTRGKITRKKLPTYRSVCYTPNKRKKNENEIYKEISPIQLDIPPDQIVEVNSDSTTNSLKQKRQQINNKFQLKLCQQQNHKTNNRCSTESTSEFPVSSPSNPQQPRGGKYPARQPLLKNTLPADSFERQLAACNPQMSLVEKIQSWDCAEELSDLEDVKKFDEVFKRLEKRKKIEMKQREKDGRNKNCEFKNYDFSKFCQMILNNMKEQKQQKYNTSCQSGGAGVSGGKCVETSGSESSKSIVHVDERPSTSAVAQQQLQQRRSKQQLYFETIEPKKRIIKDIPKRNQNSTTPPQTSSSDNERDCFKNSIKNIAGPLQTHIQNKIICPSSSEEAFSQDVPHELLKTKKKSTPVTLKNVDNKSQVRPHPPNTPTKSVEKRKSIKNSQVIIDKEIESFFRPHRLNRERDKYSRSNINEVEEQFRSIIQMRLDFKNDNQAEILMEKKQELFKTPIIPQKYLQNPLMTTEYPRQNSFSPTKNENIKKDNSLSKINDTNKEIPQDKTETKSIVDDFDCVYNQQHEFCNYLGLTGMSTATAMANAVAELAQCNLARRSMRVLRQQQQERRDKSAKEERLLVAPKLKQFKEIRKREKRGCDTIPAVETDQLKSDEGSQSQVSEVTTPLPESKKKTGNNSTPKASTNSQNSFKTEKKEAEIKILCHLAVKNKETEKLSSGCVKEVTQPVREVLMRQAKHRKPEKLADEPDIISNCEGKSSHSNKNEMADSFEETSSIEKENVKKILRSPVLSTVKSLLKNTRNRSQINKEQKQIVQNEKTSVLCKPENMCHTASAAKGVDTKCASECLERENLSKDEIPNDNLVSSTPSILQKKLQIALEESRKSKPSIFIVQSLETQKENAINSGMNSMLLPKNVESAKSPPIIQARKYLKASATKYYKNNARKIFKKHKGRKYSISKPKLRKRKVIVIKTLKPKHKSYEIIKENKRELRSSPRLNENQRQNSLINNENTKQISMPDEINTSNQSKSFRTVHTETKDLEFYLDKHNNQTKTRLMARASVLLERSKRINLRGNCNVVTNKAKQTPKIQRSKLHLHRFATQNLKPNLGNETNERKKIWASLQELSPKDKKIKQTTIKSNSSSTLNLLENENVVVSSTTNTYDERPSYEPLTTPSPITLRSPHNTMSYVVAPFPIKTKDQTTQCNVSYGIHYLKTSSSPKQAMRNPLKSEHGAVLYIYNELDILIVIQERLVSFWKCSKLINMLTSSKLLVCNHQKVQQSDTIVEKNLVENCCNNSLGPPAPSSTLIEPLDNNEWIQLGELRRLNLDFEISVPYANRICLHNSTPIYLEMRAQQLPKNQRDCNLLSMYINIYYYHDEEMIAKCNSIPLDSIQSDIKSVNYTTLTDSRYFIITWPQENLLGKTRSGICKYSLTPQLDTLASIRDFKSMRHTIRYLECMSDDKLIGFGETQVSIWDYRSGDVLMNFDLEIPMGRNVGSIYFSSQDIEQNNMLILHQFGNLQNNSQPEIITIACTVTHTQPSYKVLQKTNLPTPTFNVIKSAIKTDDHLVITGLNEDELWISLTNPRLMTVIPNIQNSKRFYSRERSQLIELTEKTLNVNSLTNHVLQLAAGLALN